MIGRKSAGPALTSNCSSLLNTNMKRPYHRARKLITSGASTKPSLNTGKDMPECIENSYSKRKQIQLHKQSFNKSDSKAESFVFRL
jgi:hypothetical protein